MAITPIQPPITKLAGKNPADAPGLFANLVSGIVGLLLIVAALYSFLQFFLGGLSWMTSGGDKSKVEAAQKRITNAIIGLVITFSCWAIFLLIFQFLGISGPGPNINLTFPTLF
ncbi:hypothetical protein A2Y99_00140 [Candidatus Gottesmanbacteria bacterium RBG_13_37_7]|uniref:Uncharacterized protein n=1 Tax=Candidatus Gottesmanbacteria bacterium RBG_13_37_7 TaxID=1798369 RepID=A0A1F5YGW8_9BACT|nr:MAG: hypothetical protein A2Y99_00140 [Candidatus Gottesmanbacteria bacterium RBG_13_37_7]